MGRNALRIPVAGLALTCFLVGGPQPASAKDVIPAETATEAEIANLQKMRIFQDAVGGSPQPTPFGFPIPNPEFDLDPTGYVETYMPATSPNLTQSAFFKELGTNGRTCFTCHQPQDGWTRSAASVSAEFNANGGTDPIFRLVDGATCPSDDVSTVPARAQAYKLLTGKGLIRIGIVPAGGGGVRSDQGG